LDYGGVGALSSCSTPPYCCCEAVAAGHIAQFSNSWSTFSFVLVGVLIALHYQRQSLLDDATMASAIRKDSRYIALYASIIVYMGPGSFFFHASMTEWGRIADGFSMYLFILYVICYGIASGWGLSFKEFFRLYVGLSVVFLCQRLVGFPSTVGVFASLVTVSCLLHLHLSTPLNRLPRWLRFGRTTPAGRPRRWLVTAFTFFIVALGIWGMSDTGMPWCDPHSVWQGHAVWHVLASLSTGSIYLYFCDVPNMPAVAPVNRAQPLESSVMLDLQTIGRLPVSQSK